MILLYEFHTLDELPDPLHADPKGFDARFSIALATEKAAEADNLSDHLSDAGQCFGNGFLAQEISGLPFLGREEQGGFQVGMHPPQAHQPAQSPGDDQIDGKRQFDFRRTRQLQGLDPAAVCRDMEEDFDFPARPVPIDQFRYGFQGGRRPIGQQSPFDRLDAARGLNFPAIKQVTSNRPPPAGRNSIRRLPISWRTWR